MLFKCFLSLSNVSLLSLEKMFFFLMMEIESESNIQIKSNHDFHWIVAQNIEFAHRKVKCLKIDNANSKVVRFDWVIYIV